MEIQIKHFKAKALLTQSPLLEPPVWVGASSLGSSGSFCEEGEEEEAEAHVRKCCPRGAAACSLRNYWSAGELKAPLTLWID